MRGISYSSDLLAVPSFQKPGNSKYSDLEKISFALMQSLPLFLLSFFFNVMKFYGSWSVREKATHDNFLIITGQSPCVKGRNDSQFYVFFTLSAKTKNTASLERKIFEISVIAVTSRKWGRWREYRTIVAVHVISTVTRLKSIWAPRNIMLT